VSQFVSEAFDYIDISDSTLKLGIPEDVTKAGCLHTLAQLLFVATICILVYGLAVEFTSLKTDPFLDYEAHVYYGVAVAFLVSGVLFSVVSAETPETFRHYLTVDLESGVIEDNASNQIPTDDIKGILLRPLDYAFVRRVNPRNGQPYSVFALTFNIDILTDGERLETAEAKLETGAFNTIAEASTKLQECSSDALSFESIRMQKGWRIAYAVAEYLDVPLFDFSSTPPAIHRQQDVVAFPQITLDGGMPSAESAEFKTSEETEDNVLELEPRHFAVPLALLVFGLLLTSSGMLVDGLLEYWVIGSGLAIVTLVVIGFFGHDKQIRVRDDRMTFPLLGWLPISKTVHREDVLAVNGRAHPPDTMSRLSEETSRNVGMVEPKPGIWFMTRNGTTRIPLASDYSEANYLVLARLLEKQWGWPKLRDKGSDVKTSRLKDNSTPQ
jgi:hypothetical protein